jgi:dUTP pyrophosphatase
MNKFEVVSKYINEDGTTAISLPVRATAHSAGYDFEVAQDIIIPSMRGMMKEFENGYIATKVPYPYTDMKMLTKITGFKPTLIPTGIKCQLDEGKYLEISVRSSTPLNSWIILANGVGIIDGDYYNNPDNEGEIFFQVINLSPADIVLNAGDKIGQGIIKSYDKIEGDNVIAERTGGLGSTSN